MLTQCAGRTAYATCALHTLIRGGGRRDGSTGQRRAGLARDSISNKTQVDLIAALRIESPNPGCYR